MPVEFCGQADALYDYSRIKAGELGNYPMRRSAPGTPEPIRSRIIRYDWQRFWIPQTGVLDLADAGFLRDPDGDHFGPDVLRSLSDLQAYRALALLGEPGIGKSSELRQEHDRINALIPIPE